MDWQELADGWEHLEPIGQTIELDEDLLEALVQDKQDEEERQAKGIRKACEAEAHRAPQAELELKLNAKEVRKLYKYEELPDRACFRLLRLSSSEVEDAIPQCLLAKFDPESSDIPSYRAVS
jgi:hypothetical protein